MVTEVARSLEFAPSMHAFADRVVAAISKRWPEYNAAHLRIEKDARDWSQIMGGPEVRRARTPTLRLLVLWTWPERQGSLEFLRGKRGIGAHIRRDGSCAVRGCAHAAHISPTPRARLRTYHSRLCVHTPLIPKPQGRACGILSPKP